jgi:hypothetical protein
MRYAFTQAVSDKRVLSATRPRCSAPAAVLATLLSLRAPRTPHHTPLTD